MTKKWLELTLQASAAPAGVQPGLDPVLMHMAPDQEPMPHQAELVWQADHLMAHRQSWPTDNEACKLASAEIGPLLQASASPARVQPGMGPAPRDVALGPGEASGAQQAELLWQADALQRQVAALQEEREALAQHLDHMQDALVAAKEKGAPHPLTACSSQCASNAGRPHGRQREGCPRTALLLAVHSVPRLLLLPIMYGGSVCTHDAYRYQPTSCMRCTC